MTRLHLYVATVFLVLNIAFTAQNINYTCVSVSTSTCATGYQYRVRGVFEAKVLNFTYCADADNQCGKQTSIAQTIDIQSCKIDYKAQVCESQICYMKPGIQMCTKDSSNCTSGSYNSLFQCIDCTVKNSSCAKCLKNTTGAAIS